MGEKEGFLFFSTSLEQSPREPLIERIWRISACFTSLLPQQPFFSIFYFSALYEFDVISIGIGLLGGMCAFGATWGILNALRFGKVSTSWTILGLSLVIPTMASIIFWGERLTFTKGLGFVLVCISIILIGKDR